MYSLVFPDASHKDRYLAMIDEWGNFEHIPTSPSRLFSGDTYEEFLEIVKKDIVDSDRGVNSTLWFFMKGEDILGSIQLRHHIDHPMLREAGGHIGYGIRPSARGMGYAKEMLYLGLAEAKNMGIDVVKLSADEDNPASWKTIERCGGVFYKTLIKDNIPLKFYHIHTSI